MASYLMEFLLVLFLLFVVDFDVAESCGKGNGRKTEDCVVTDNSATDECYKLHPDLDFCQQTFCELAEIGKKKNPNLCGFTQYNDPAVGCPRPDIAPIPNLTFCQKKETGKCYKSCVAWNKDPDNVKVGTSTTEKSYAFTNTVAYVCTVPTVSKTKRICGCAQVGKPAAESSAAGNAARVK